jgi:hypothetical protein
MVGRTLSALPAGPLWRWDRSAALEVEIASGAVASVPEESALAGDNLFALRGPDGRWEILSAMQAELTGERTYRLSRLLRGLAGTEPQAARVLPAGAVLVRLDEAVVPLTSALSDLGATIRYRLGPAGRDHADPAATEFLATIGPDALVPFAPVRIAARREAEGVRLRWIRRTRRDGDAWEPLDVPLGEDAERYRIDILQGGVLRRSLESPQPTVLYAAADEIADFGAPQTSLDLAVSQWSASVGPGVARRATVAVDV